MRTRTKAGIVAGALAATAATGTGVAVAAGGSEDGGPDVAITGTDLERASTAALESTGGGRVTGTEVGDEESYYEVEVTLDNGNSVDVQLDESFNVVSNSADVESPDD